MIAKIVQGRGLRGVVNYVLDKDNAQLLYSEGVRTKDQDSIIRSFVTQSKMNPKIARPIAHISLDFSAQDKVKLSNEFMVRVAQEYLKKMGYENTQYIIARHHDTDHSHIHMVINRIDNDGKRITDQNEKLRSTKVCMELTKKYGLYIASGKENVKEHRLKEPDKTKYEIYHALQSAIPKCRNWQQLQTEVQKSGITIDLRKNGSTERIQGVRFDKNGYGFNGSKIDRSCSYSKISFQLQQNDRQQQTDLHQQPQTIRQDHSPGLSSMAESVVSGLGGLFDIQPSSGYDENEVEAKKQEAKKKKKKKRRKI
ncbi:relaxase/mobilization nuclease domain-containing protein [Bacteroides sp. UBA939]|uniref:relaxase/mobilization nuclease domain-containing protein n=1 Tax=Bacteroides sp. UBA939 TaxID=1946092 RepID=UPI0025BCB2D2|nr:relaxase/mobilization nuclease domain-containing protein [Bacteroides sp. UBA939]